MMNNKNLGQYFTPEYVANFMISLSKIPKSAKILEPSCGKGIFLKLLENKGYKNLIGYEIDKTLQIITNAKIIYKSFVDEKIIDKYDLIIGNPPYIRWKNLDKELKVELEKNELWQRNFNSLSDYLCIFILKSVELLKDGGELIFITPEYWINTKHAQTLRNYLIKNGYFTDIIHFNETPIFDKVASSILIFRFVKSSSSSSSSSLVNKKIKVIKYHSNKKLNNDILCKIKDGIVDEKIEKFEIDQFLLNENWMLMSDNVGKKLREFENKCLIINEKTFFKSNYKYSSLGDIAEIANGMVSGLDRAFQIPEGIKLTENESKAILPVLKAKNINQYIYDSINKYIFINDDVKTESVLIEKYPTFYKLLSIYKDELEKRYNYNRHINYWEWVFLRSFNLFKQERERIFVPCKERISHKNYFRFAYVPSGIFPTQDVTSIFLKPEIKESIYYILALLNCEYIFQWLKCKGVVKGNIVEFSEKPLTSIPIKRIDWNNEIEVKLHDEIKFYCKEYVLNQNKETLELLNSKINALF